MKPTKLALIGLDTSHAKIFTRLLNDPTCEHYASRGAVAFVGYPGGSPDFRASIGRVAEITKDLRDHFGLRIAASPEEAAEQADAVMLTAVDGRVHPELFRRIVRFGKPVFIDKPLAVSYADAVEISRLSAEYGVAWMSSSVRRYAARLIKELQDGSKGPVTGVDSFGPIEFVSSQPGWYWYGIHIVEVLYAVLGSGCKTVTVVSHDGHEVLTGVWDDGRIGVARGNRHPNIAHGALIHRAQGSVHVDTSADGQAKYALLLDEALKMFRTGTPHIDPAETLEMIRFIEAANESRITGTTIEL